MMENQCSHSDCLTTGKKTYKKTDIMKYDYANDTYIACCTGNFMFSGIAERLIQECEI